MRKMLNIPVAAFVAPERSQGFGGEAMVIEMDLALHGVLRCNGRPRQLSLRGWCRRDN